MPSLNRVEVIGHFGKDPEIRYVSNGSAVANFSVATSEKWNDKQTGEKKEKTEWHNVVAWGKLGEIVGEYASKGRLVYVEGKLQTRKWDDKDGVTRYTTEIVASQVLMLDKGGHKPVNADPVRPRPALNENMAGDEIPF